MKPLEALLCLFLVSIPLLGCATASGRKPFSPPPEAYERWEKSGSSSVQIRIALLECGLPAPFSVHKFFKDIPHEELLELHANVELCMMRSGFGLMQGLSPICKDNSKLQACHIENDYLIPSRDSARRMNSSFCKDPIYGKNKACQP